MNTVSDLAGVTLDLKEVQKESLVIGITGTIGAGKGTIVDFLVKQKSFKHFSARGFITEEIEKRNLEVNRDNMVLVGNDLREKYGPSYVADQLYERAKTSGGDCILESLRTPGEIESLRSKGNFYLLAIDADPKTRYERVLGRSSSTDNISFEKFLADELREMESDDPNKQNLRKCIGMADFIIMNNGSFEDLNAEVEKILNIIQNNEKK